MIKRIENRQTCLQHEQAQQACRMPLLWKICIVIVLALLFQNETFAEQKLAAGKWKGTFLTHDGVLYKIQYIVSYGDVSPDAPVKIKMINLDLEPTSEFTYTLSDIKIEDQQLRFKIPKEFETKTCTLIKENGSYAGTCSSTAGSAEETSEITMVPPADDSSKSN